MGKPCLVVTSRIFLHAFCLHLLLAGTGDLEFSSVGMFLSDVDESEAPFVAFAASPAPASCFLPFELVPDGSRLLAVVSGLPMFLSSCCLVLNLIDVY